MRTLLPTTVLALALFAVTGCGQTGPLQLPPREAPAPAVEPQQEPAGTTEAAPATAPASNG